MLEGGDETVANYFLGGGVRVAGADVVYAFEDRGVLDAAMGEHVSVDSSKSVRSQAIVQDAVPTCGLIYDCDGRGVVVGLHAGEDKVGPAVVFVVVATSAVGDAIPYDSEGAVVLGGVDFDRRE